MPAAYERMLASTGPYLIDLRIPRDQSVFPIVAPGKALSEAVGAIDLDEGVVRIVDQPEADEEGGKAL